MKFVVDKDEDKHNIDIGVVSLSATHKNFKTVGTKTLEKPMSAHTCTPTKMNIPYGAIVRINVSDVDLKTTLIVISLPTSLPVSKILSNITTMKLRAT